jgi:predicted metal-dependent phosphoesterase TrpH
LADTVQRVCTFETRTLRHHQILHAQPPGVGPAATGGFVKLDLHVHTTFSGRTTIYPLSLIMQESYNSPEGVYRRAKGRGMDLVTITDHDQIDGALTIADRPDVIIGCEVTGVFPDDGVRVHLGVLGINETQHREIQRLRHDIRELMPYLKSEEIFTSLNHVASRINGEVTAPHIAALMPWLDGIEIINGSRLPTQNRTAACLAGACGKVGVAGSDSHTRRGIGRTWVEAPHATTREEFLTDLHAGRVTVGGRQGNYFTMASDMLRLAAGFYEDRVTRAAKDPLNWRAHAFVLGGLLGLPLVALPLAGALAHFILEERFNRSLLFDLVARPASLRMPEAA